MVIIYISTNTDPCKTTLYLNIETLFLDTRMQRGIDKMANNYFMFKKKLFSTCMYTIPVSESLCDRKWHGQVISSVQAQCTELFRNLLLSF